MMKFIKGLFNSFNYRSRAKILNNRIIVEEYIKHYTNILDLGLYCSIGKGGTISFTKECLAVINPQALPYVIYNMDNAHPDKIYFIFSGIGYKNNCNRLTKYDVNGSKLCIHVMSYFKKNNIPLRKIKTDYLLTKNLDQYSIDLSKPIIKIQGN